MYQGINSIASRINQYPEPEKNIPREIHAPCIVHKIASNSRTYNNNNSSSNNNSSIVLGNVDLYDKVGEDLFSKFKRAGKYAVQSLRFVKKVEKVVEKEVIDVDKEVENGEKEGNNDEMVSKMDEVGKSLGTLTLVSSDDDANEKGECEDLLQKAFQPLTEEEKNEVHQALSFHNRRKVLVTHEKSNIEITGEVLQCLGQQQWLNDEVINVYFELLKEREEREPNNFLKCHFFNTFFYKKLISGKSGYDFKSVRRWTTQKKLGYNVFECDKIFVPIHKQAHWCLAVINKRDKKFHYLDSLGGIDTKVLSVLAMYLVDEVKDKNGVDINVDSWTQEHVKSIPLQKNGWDCGMFMIKYVDFYSRGVQPCFNQEHMPYFRSRTTKEILRLEAR